MTLGRPAVSVPVLSEQMTVVLPRVSTAGSLRMMALRSDHTPQIGRIAGTRLAAAGRLNGPIHPCDAWP